MEYVEVTGRSVEMAIAAALEELGIESRDQANIEVLEEGAKGFLGIGGKDAVVKVSRKPKRRRRRRRRGAEGDGSDKAEPTAQSKGAKPAQKQGRNQGGSSRNGGGKPSGGSTGRQEGRRNGGSQVKEAAPADSDEDVQEQVRMVEEFLRGLVAAMGLEGEVTSRVEDGLIKADVSGEQTEVLVGAKGSMIRVIQELARTVIQRQHPRPRRVIIDIAGYGARRREALAIYAQRLAGSVLVEGGEIMLEAMNSADRKVVHDTISEIEDVHSYSEGEEPRRSVVIATVEGYIPPAREESEDEEE